MSAARIRTAFGDTMTGEIRCWHGRRVVEIETSEGRREFGRLAGDCEPLSTVDGAEQVEANPPRTWGVRA